MHFDIDPLHVSEIRILNSVFSKHEKKSLTCEKILQTKKGGVYSLGEEGANISIEMSYLLKLSKL